MMEKSYVGLEFFIDPITGEKHNDGGGVLLDRRLRNSLEHENIVGYKVCNETQKMLDDNYVALVEIDNEVNDSIKILQQDEANRTGNIVWMKRHVVNDMFNTAIGKMCFIDKEVFNKVKELGASIE